MLDVSDQNRPAELYWTTLEYVPPQRGPFASPIFLFVIDTCLDEEELKALRASLVAGLSLLPSNAIVGVVTFGAMVQVHELTQSDCMNSYVFRGSKEYTTEQVQDMLGLPPLQPTPQAAQQALAANRFLMPAKECDLAISTLFEQLQQDPWPVEHDKRPARCTGTAMSVALSLLESSTHATGARIMLFASGPPTQGAGQVVSVELKEPIRSHNDLEKDAAKYYKKACKFYEGLARRAADKAFAIDIFAGCLDQVGLAELKPLVTYTNGVMILSDGFATNIFRSSFMAMWNKDPNTGELAQAYNVTLEVCCSRELKISGLIGPCVSLNQKGVQVGDTEIGIGGTRAWRICNLLPSTTVGVYLELANTQPGAVQPGSLGLIQFITTYQHASGIIRRRVTTAAARWASDNPGPEIAYSFDQEAAVALMARIAVFKAELEDGPDALRWLDRMLIRLCQKFADYRKDDPQSFRLPETFGMYPNFMFHLRRSQFLQVFNNSPDETAFYRSIICREDANNTLLMIQPSLNCYSFDAPPMPVLLDSIAIKTNVILILDTFFHVLVWHGRDIAQWREAGYHKQPGYEGFNDMLQQAENEAKSIVIKRFPVPRYIICDQGGSQARFLLSRLNPSTTHMTNSTAGGFNDYQSSGGMMAAQAGGQAIFTDDVSLQVFMEHLKKLTVSGSS